MSVAPISGLCSCYAGSRASRGSEGSESARTASQGPRCGHGSHDVCDRLAINPLRGEPQKPYGAHRTETSCRASRRYLSARPSTLARQRRAGRRPPHQPTLTLILVEQAGRVPELVETSVDVEIDGDAERPHKRQSLYCGARSENHVHQGAETDQVRKPGHARTQRWPLRQRASEGRRLALERPLRPLAQRVAVARPGG
jgi:hypothetical protein